MNATPEGLALWDGLAFYSLQTNPHGVLKATWSGAGKENQNRRAKASLTAPALSFSLYSSFRRLRGKEATWFCIYPVCWVSGCWEGSWHGRDLSLKGQQYSSWLSSLLLQRLGWALKSPFTVGMTPRYSSVTLRVWSPTGFSLLWLLGRFTH